MSAAEAAPEELEVTEERIEKIRATVQPCVCGEGVGGTCGPCREADLWTFISQQTVKRDQAVSLLRDLVESVEWHNRNIGAYGECPTNPYTDDAEDFLEGLPS